MLAMMSLDKISDDNIADLKGVLGVRAYHCFGCDDSSPRASTQEGAEVAAYEAGWQIGHMDGQAYFACPYCACQLFDPLPLYPMHLDFRKMREQRIRNQ